MKTCHSFFLAPLKRSVFLGIAFVSAAATVLAQPPEHIPISELRQVQLPDVTLNAVRSVPSDLKTHTVAHVSVDGTIGGNIRFELLLPEDWNGRFVMGGGGGFVGTVQNEARDSVNRGYATVGTDTGHEWTPGYMAGWAENNLEAQLDFGYLAVHRTALVAKALVRAFYQTNIAYSYFVGCSRGGGQAMMEAQRYPADFDGIVAGAPAFNWTGIAAMVVEIAQAIYPDPNHLDHPVLDDAALQSLANGILDQCDAQDGLKDGIIENPGIVRFDLSKVSGLTAEQRKATEAVFRGAYKGSRLIYPGFTPGAECVPGQWKAWLVGPIAPLLEKDHVPDLSFAFGTQIFKYLIFDNPDWDYSTYNFSNFQKDTRLPGSFLNATNADLRPFKNRNGKLILWHGWADTALPPQATIDYYREVQAHDPNATNYCRLFMIPGCCHCGGGPGASEVDWVSAIVDWVEHGKAPDRLIASRTVDGKVVMTRPLYPYPDYAVYNGKGNPDKAQNFRKNSRN